MFDETPEASVLLVYHASDGGHRQMLSQFHHQAFEKQGEAGTFSGSRNGECFDAMFATLNAGKIGVGVGLVLEEVKMAPDPRHGIVGSRLCPAF